MQQRSAGPRYAAWVVAVFFLAAMLSYTDRLILNLLVDPIRHDLGISDTQVSILQGAAFAVLYAFVGLPLGRLADRFNRRNLILAGVLIWSMGTAACGYATSFWGLFAARLAVGLGEAALSPAAVSMIQDYFPPDRRGGAIGVYLTGMTMGGGASVIVGGALLQGFQAHAIVLPSIFGHLDPWREVLVTLCLPGLGLAALFLTVREPPRRENLTGAAPGAFSTTLGFFSKNRWTFGLLYGSFALANLVGYGSDSWLPTTLIRRFGLSPAVVGSSIGVVALLCGGLGTLLGGFLSDRLQARRSDGALRFTLAASLAALPLLVFPLLSPVGWVLAAYGAYGLIGGMAGTAALTATQNVVPGEMRGFAVSLQAFMYTLIGLGLGPTTVAFTTDHLFHDPKAVGLSIVVVCLPVSLISAFLLWRALRFYRATYARVVVTPDATPA